MFYRIIRRLAAIIFAVFYRVQYTGRDNIPEGAALLCANHSALKDSVLLAILLPPTVKINFMAKAELFKIPLFGPFIRALGAFPVDRKISDIGAIKKGLKTLQDGKKLVVFPEGRRMKDQEAGDAKRGAILLASRTGAPLTPIFITSGPKHPFTKIKVVVGKPYVIRRDQVNTPAGYQNQADLLLRRIASLGDLRIPVRQEQNG